MARRSSTPSQFPATPQGPDRSRSSPGRVDENAAPVAVIEHPVPPAPRRRRTRIAVAGTVGALGLATAVGFGIGTAGASSTVVGVGTAADAATIAPGWSSPGSAGTRPGTGSWPYGSSSGGTTGTAASATADQQIGVVDIDTVLGYQNGEAAGTGMVLTAD